MLEYLALSVPNIAPALSQLVEDKMTGVLLMSQNVFLKVLLRSLSIMHHDREMSDQFTGSTFTGHIFYSGFSMALEETLQLIA